VDSYLVKKATVFGIIRDQLIRQDVDEPTAIKAAALVIKQAEEGWVQQLLSRVNENPTLRNALYGGLGGTAAGATLGILEPEPEISYKKKLQRVLQKALTTGLITSAVSGGLTALPKFTQGLEKKYQTT